MKSATRDRTLRRVAKVPQTKMKSCEVNLQKPFSRAMSFVCILTQLRRLQLVDKMKNAVGSRPNAVCSKIVVSPPVNFSGFIEFKFANAPEEGILSFSSYLLLVSQF